jgi:hypothetical protein
MNEDMRDTLAQAFALAARASSQEEFNVELRGVQHMSEGQKTQLSQWMELHRKQLISTRFMLQKITELYDEKYDSSELPIPALDEGVDLCQPPDAPPRPPRADRLEMIQ